jgi:oligoendopeptidase F
MAEKGEPVTGERMSELYLKLLRTYYGHDQGVCEVKDLYGIEWAYIPHFYYNFYVYQYATSLTASSQIAANMRADAKARKPTTKSRDAYLKMLSSGSSKYPIDLLKDAGVDMTTSGPFRAAIAEMNAVMDEMEKLLAPR